MRRNSRPTPSLPSSCQRARACLARPSPHAVLEGTRSDRRILDYACRKGLLECRFVHFVAADGRLRSSRNLGVGLPIPGHVLALAACTASAIAFALADALDAAEVLFGCLGIGLVVVGWLGLIWLLGVGCAEWFGGLAHIPDNL